MPACVATGMPRRSKRLLIAPQLGACRRQQGDVARLARTFRAAAPVDDGLAADQARAQLGDGVGFGVALLLGAGFAVFVGYGDVEGRDTQAFAAIVVERVEGGKAGLPIGREHDLEALVDEGEDRGAGAEIGGDRQEAVGILGAKGVARLHVGADIGAAEAIDRLLGIADQEERARPDPEPGPVVIAIDRLAAQPPEDFGLQRIGVLELIDEDMREALSQRAPDIVMVAQQIARGEDQIVEVELGARALVVAIALQDRTRLLDQRRQNLAGRGLKKRSPGVAAGGVVDLGGDRSADRHRPWRGRPASPRRPICPSCDRRRRRRPWCKGPDAGREVRSRTRPAGVAGSGPAASAVAISPSRWTITTVSGSVAAVPAHEGREIRRGLPERRQMTVKRGDGWCREGAAAAQILGDLMDERHGLTGAVQHHFGEDAALVAGQALAQPAIDDFEEGEIGLVAVHDAGAGIDVGLRRIGLDQALAEAVDGRAGDFVDRGARGREIVALRLRQAVGQRHAQFGGDVAGREVGDKFADAREQLAGRELGEGDGGDGARRDAFGEHDGDASGHDGGLARARAGFDQDRPIMEADRVAARAVVLERFGHAAHHSASQT